jgi:beta-mannanase
MAHKYPPHAELVVAVPIVPEVPGVTLQKAAQGDYQQHYTAAAQALARYGHGDAIVRIGWEFQGNWFPWGYNYPGQDKAHFCSNYKAAFRNVVKAFRGVSQDFKFDWNPALSDSSQMPDLAACYPGDDDVDMIGLDIYDFNYAHIGDPKQRFKHDVLDRQYGLEWQAKFAAEHHKPLSYPEWGAGGVGDNPYFIGAMHDWFDNHNVAYQCYWDAPRSSGYNGELSEHPAQRAMFQRLFGAAKR